MLDTDQHRYRATFREMAALALPIVGVQVGTMFMGVVDTMVVGRVSATALAAVAVGNLYTFAVLAFGLGTLMALDPIVAQAVGARDDAAISRAVQRGVVLACLLSIPISLAYLPATALLRLARQPDDLIPAATQFIHLSIPGVLGFLLFVVLRQTLQAMGRLAPIVWTILIANLVNLALNWVLVFGHLGLPPLGVVGAALATTCARWVMTVTLFLLTWRSLRPRLTPWQPASLDRASLFGMFRVGAPIGLQYLLEIGVFATVGFLMGILGTNQIAGHQVAINLASLTFNVPLGVSSAAAVMVGRAVGAEDEIEARHASVAALFLAIGFMTVSAITFLSVPHALARLYTATPEVLAVAAALLPLAGLFQIFDGIQVTAIGVLRGLGDTRTPMLVNLLGFWLLGLPISVALGFRAGLGPAGLWWGLVAGLVVVAAILILRVRVKLARGARRLHYESVKGEGARS